MGRFHFSLSKKAIFLIVVFVILLIAVPLTVYIVQQQQQTQSSAAPATILSFTKSAPTTPTAKIGDEITFDIMAAPGTNIVTELLVYIKYDAEKLKPDETEFFKPEPSLETLGYNVYRNPTITDETEGIFSFGYTLSSQTATASNLGIRCPTDQTTCPAVKIGALKFSAISVGTAQVSYLRTEPNSTLVMTGGGGTNIATENALYNATPGEITIVAPEESPSPSPSDSASPSPSPSDSASPSPSASPIGEAPVCSSLDADSIDGTAPLAVTFTANGSDSDGTVDKISLDYGDGNTEDVTESGGLGTATVSAQASHTYSDGGTFEASAVLTDSDENASEACTQTITVASATEVAQATPSASPLPATGPSREIVGIGILGALLTGLGFLLFLAL